MFRFRLNELMEEREARDGKATSLSELARDTGIHRVTLSKIFNGHPYNASLDVIGALCIHFQCRVEDVVEFVPEGRSSKKAKAATARRTGAPPRKR